MEETLEEFKERTKDLTEAELKMEFLENYRELVMKYRFDFIQQPIQIIKIDQK